MNRATLILIVSVVFLTNSCGPNLKNENKKTREVLIAVHDEVMPQMGKLKSYEKKATQKLEVLRAESSTDSLQIAKFSKLVEELDAAYEGMFVWMRQYEVEDGDKEPLVIKAYLEEQMIQVTEVNQNIKNVLQKAEMELEN
jgi:hypothetical protein